jgi:hypothetical protein
MTAIADRGAGPLSCVLLTGESMTDPLQIPRPWDAPGEPDTAMTHAGRDSA